MEKFTTNQENAELPKNNLLERLRLTKKLKDNPPYEKGSPNRERYLEMKSRDWGITQDVLYALVRVRRHELGFDDGFVFEYMEGIAELSEEEKLDFENQINRIDQSEINAIIDIVIEKYEAYLQGGEDAGKDYNDENMKGVLKQVQLLNNWREGV